MLARPQAATTDFTNSEKLHSRAFTYVYQNSSYKKWDSHAQMAAGLGFLSFSRADPSSVSMRLLLMSKCHRLFPLHLNSVRKNVNQVRVYSLRIRKALLGNQLCDRTTAARAVHHSTRCSGCTAWASSTQIAKLTPNSENKESPTMTSPLSSGLYKHKAAAIQLVHTNQPSSHLFPTSSVLPSLHSQYHFSFRTPSHFLHS